MAGTFAGMSGDGESERETLRRFDPRGASYVQLVNSISNVIQNLRPGTRVQVYTYARQIGRAVIAGGGYGYGKAAVST
jgi:hypothetical protein